MISREMLAEVLRMVASVSQVIRPVVELVCVVISPDDSDDRCFRCDVIDERSSVVGKSYDSLMHGGVAL